MSDDVFVLPLNIISFFTIYYREMGSNHPRKLLITGYLVCYAIDFPCIYSEKGMVIS